MDDGHVLIYMIMRIRMKVDRCDCDSKKALAVLVSNRNFRFSSGDELPRWRYWREYEPDQRRRFLDDLLPVADDAFDHASIRAQRAVSDRHRRWGWCKIVSISELVISVMWFHCWRSSGTGVIALSRLCCLYRRAGVFCGVASFCLIAIWEIFLFQENKMDIQNLSVIMTPNFMPAPIDDKEGKSSAGTALSSQGEETKSLERRTAVVAFLLNMARK